MIRRSLIAVTAATFFFVVLVKVGFSYETGQYNAPTSYRVVRTIPIAGNEGWDYVTVDTESRRVYISRGTRVVVLDADTDSVVGEIPGTDGVHGVAVAGPLGRGFTSNGRANNVTIFDLKTLKALGTAKTGNDPDAIIYEPATHRVFTMNGDSQDMTAIDAASGTVVGTLPLGGTPESAAVDGQGSLFVNLADKSQLLQIDPRNLAILHAWPLAPCEDPAGLAIDPATHRLFVGCRNKVMAIVDAGDGRVIATLPIGSGVDANAFDPGTRLAFASNGEGTITVVREDSPDKFSVAQTVPTQKSARTLGVDSKTHNIFLPAADFEPPAPGERRGKMKPGTFVVLVAAMG